MVLEDRNFQVDFLKSKTSNSLDIFYWVLFVFLSSKGWTQCKNSLFLGEKVHCEYFCVWNTGRDANCMCIPMFDFLALVQRFVSEIEKMIPLLTCFIKSSRLNAYVKSNYFFLLLTRKLTLLTQIIDFQTLFWELVAHWDGEKIIVHLKYCLTKTCKRK